MGLSVSELMTMAENMSTGWHGAEAVEKERERERTVPVRNSTGMYYVF